MKAFYLTIILFFLTVLLIFSNAAHVADFTKDTVENLDDLIFSKSDDCVMQIENFSNETRNQIAHIEFSIPHDKTARLLQKLDLLTIYARNNNKTEFETTRSDLFNILAEISELEKISFFGIL